MIQVHNVCLSYGSQTIFDHISFILDQHDRIGLIGRNGSGKTTLLKNIVDQTFLDDGSITIQKNKKLAYMPQEVVLQSTLSILDETLTAFPTLCALQHEIAQLELREHIEDPTTIEQYVTLQEQLALLSPETIKAKAKKILTGLGFPPEQFDQPVANLSVGWKMRIVLAQLLLQEADFYLFDEPTNHLDLISKEWFLDFLKKANFGFILICHERYFLDELCTKIMELERGKITWYATNYSGYVIQKEHNDQLIEAAYNQQQKEIKRKQATIERFRASASRARMAQSMEKSLEKIERIALPLSSKNIQFSFPPIQQSGKEVVRVEHLSQKFGDKTVFQNVSFEVKRGQKVALIAPNGVGKTTLFNVITGALPVQYGNITFGYNVTHAIFAQDQNKALNPERSVLDNIKYLCPEVPESKIRSFLGAFLFSGTDTLKKVKVLSGGEKNRVGMVGVLLQSANLLLLDEPTNHLDIPSKGILLKALQEFKGTVLIVSHDRDFINELATDIIELTPQGTHHYQGNYDDFVYHKQTLAPTHAETKKKHVAQKKHEPIDEKTVQDEVVKKIHQKEATIIKLEKQILDLSTSFTDIEYGTPEFTATVTKLRELQKELRKIEEEWEHLYKMDV